MHKKNKKIQKSLAAVHRIDRVHCASCLYKNILCQIKKQNSKMPVSGSISPLSEVTY